MIPDAAWPTVYTVAVLTFVVWAYEEYRDYRIKQARRRLAERIRRMYS